MRIRWTVFLVVAIALALGACSTPGERITELNVPLVQLQKIADANVPVKRKKISRNGREFYSVPFRKKDGDFVQSTEDQVHYMAVIRVLGDRRPYTIQVEVNKQMRLSNGAYKILKYEEGLSKLIRRRIQTSLYQRREDRNIIDDFKVF